MIVKRSSTVLWFVTELAATHDCKGLSRLFRGTKYQLNPDMKFKYLMGFDNIHISVVPTYIIFLSSYRQVLVFTRPLHLLLSSHLVFLYLLLFWIPCLINSGATLNSHPALVAMLPLQSSPSLASLLLFRDNNLSNSKDR